MMVNKSICVAASIFFVGILLAAGVQSGGAAETAHEMPQVDESLYSVEPEVLLPADCGQCHVSQFGDLRLAGGKHRFSCQECHQQFHAYNPRKNNYDELMPKCDDCHGQPHGPKQADCLTCHNNPHAPLDVPVLDRLVNSCADCHSAPAAELVQSPSAHTEQGCQECHHDGHGYIPSCFECHDGHYEGQSAQGCAECHAQVHAPLNIRFAVDTETQSCKGCHGPVYNKWQNTPSKHGGVMCSMCHQEHGMIPDCQECHGEPHLKQQLEMFPNCLSCHVDVHDLPVKKKN